ncbi:VOC family protein [Kaarinaea lacus]
MPQEQENKINYIEIPVKNVAETKAFFAKLFAWEFLDFGPDYSSFVNAGINGGFYKSDNNGFSSEHSPLIVIYTSDLEKIKGKILSVSGKIVKNTFAFPGGRRFHFTDINNNEFAVWTDKPE